MGKHVVRSVGGEAVLFSPVKGAGKAHILVTDKETTYSTGPTALADSQGKVSKWCGGKLTASNVVAGVTRPVCDTCAEYVNSDSFREETAEDGETLADLIMEGGGTLITMFGAEEIPAKGAKPYQGREVDTVALATDGKCAFERENEETGEMELVTVNGRMRIAPVDGSESSDQNGNSVGVCPICRQLAKLTNSGAIGTHRPSNITPDGSPLPGRALDWRQADGHKTREAEVSGRGEDASKIRERIDRVRDRITVITEGLEVVTESEELEKLSARRAAGLAQERELVAKLRGAERDWSDQDEGKYAPGVRDHGRSDGVAMLPLGETGFAGMRFDDTNEHATADGVARTPGVSALGRPEYVGGRNGFLTPGEYEGLSRSQQRNYWRKVKRMDDRGKAVRARRRDLRERGVSVPRGEGPNATRPYANMAAGMRMDGKPQNSKGKTLNGLSAMVTK